MENTEREGRDRKEQGTEKRKYREGKTEGKRKDRRLIRRRRRFSQRKDKNNIKNPRPDYRFLSVLYPVHLVYSFVVFSLPSSLPSLCPSVFSVVQSLKRRARPTVGLRRTDLPLPEPPDFSGRHKSRG